MLEEGHFQGVELQGSTKHFDNAREKLVDSIASCLQNRFQDIESGVLGATKLADFQKWPSQFEKGKPHDCKSLIFLFFDINHIKSCF